MNEKFPYGYDVNAYIDKAFEQMKADFPWATREMIAEHTCYGIAKVGDDYQYVAYWNNDEGSVKHIPKKQTAKDSLGASPKAMNGNLNGRTP